MQVFDLKRLFIMSLMAVVIGGCAVQKPSVRPDQPQARPQSEQPEPPVVAEPPPLPRIDTMADVPGDKRKRPGIPY